jgi:hypothetical protein
MSLAELLPLVDALSPGEKQELVRHLTQTPGETAKLAEHFPPGFVAEVWSPYGAFEAAAIVQRMLDEREGETP